MRGMFDGPMRIEGDFGGMLRGDATVPAGRSAVISGMVSGDVIAEAGASVVITGMVRGRIVDRGARISVSGMTGAIIAG